MSVASQFANVSIKRTQEYMGNYTELVFDIKMGIRLFLISLYLSQGSQFLEVQRPSAKCKEVSSTQALKCTIRDNQKIRIPDGCVSSGCLTGKTLSFVLQSSFLKNADSVSSTYNQFKQLLTSKIKMMTIQCSNLLLSLHLHLKEIHKVVMAEIAAIIMNLLEIIVLMLKKIQVSATQLF